MQKLSLLIIVAVSILLPITASAAAPKQYQVTGPIVEVTDKTITVQKDSEKWVILRNADTKIKGDLKVGSKVTIYYYMTAGSVEVKDDTAKK